ncbi:MAG: hypothetical protein LBR43_02405 [Spiroplasmataceae bacterium]|jgi:hypothetical protein|nr:hypothetical protein [Spiroplasmataceae bacterium]
MKNNRLIQFKANNQLLFSVRENEFNLENMTLKYEGNNEYNFVSGITDLTFTSLLPLKKLDLVFNNQKIKEISILNAKPITNFTCFNCEQEKTDQASQVYIDGLGVNPHQLQTICPDCLFKVNIIQSKSEF